MGIATLVTAVLLAKAIFARSTSLLSHRLLENPNPSPLGASDDFSRNVSSCPGYSLTSLRETSTGIAARLRLAGAACNAFGHDVVDLTLEVTYDTETSGHRLHVNIYDTARSQFTIPTSVIQLASGSDDPSLKERSDLVFNYDASPIAFWITRRSQPDDLPLFDTRQSSLPPTPIPPVIPGDDSTALDGFPLIFEDQYLQLASALPRGANISGLGEVVASSGFRRDIGTDGGPGNIQTTWTRGASDPIDQNMYGTHPFYLEHRYTEHTGRSQSHGMLHFSAAGSDIMLLTPPSSPVSLIEYRAIGGTLDFYFFSGPSPQKVIEQYGDLIGLPTWQPYWAFGFHLCRWGYKTVNETNAQVEAMRAAGIPLETMWNDIDLYQAARDFTTDPVSYPPEEVREFIRGLVVHHQHYIPIVDAATPHVENDTDLAPSCEYREVPGWLMHNSWPLFRDVWIKNPDGSEYIGSGRPGYQVYPDWFAENSSTYWEETLRNWSQLGVEFSGLWLDLNEAVSQCIGSCGSAIGLPEASVQAGLDQLGQGAGGQEGVDLNTPPYAIHNGDGLLANKTIATNATHAGGYVELDVHNLWGLMEEKTTHLTLLTLQPDKRPFLISRSTFPSSGRWTGHWLGDNFSQWAYLYYSIQGVLQFQLFQIPMVGADTCGFNGNTTEELCNRWMQLSAFMPFYRNHNVMGALPQEPYRWESVAEASRKAMRVRYSMLPYWYTLFANASLHGTPPVRALFFEFPDEPELFSVDQQFLVGRDILVTPVLEPNATTVSGIFPGRGRVVWRDWYTHEVVNTSSGTNTTLSAPLGHINVHVRGGSAILRHAQPAYTTTETRAGPYSLLVSQAENGYAFGSAYIDDGESLPPTANTTVKFEARKGKVSGHAKGAFKIVQRLESIMVLGASSRRPRVVEINGEATDGWEYDQMVERLVVRDVHLDLNRDWALTWA
ncbi:hypothetical protein OH77DRAFT_1548060 [Trametes cingulata]|nr:hypothetical protein OH77DRAFT_1548060 [Trametes cingulata]